MQKIPPSALWALQQRLALEFAVFAMDRQVEAAHGLVTQEEAIDQSLKTKTNVIKRAEAIGILNRDFHEMLERLMPRRLNYAQRVQVHPIRRTSMHAPAHRPVSIRSMRAV